MFSSSQIGSNPFGPYNVVSDQHTIPTVSHVPSNITNLIHSPYDLKQPGIIDSNRHVKTYSTPGKDGVNSSTSKGQTVSDNKGMPNDGLPISEIL